MHLEDQASKLRQMMSQTSRPQIIAVASGKGGVGKSNVALNLSILLSACGRRTALVDADLGLANLDVLVDVNARVNLAHVIAGQKRLSDVVIDLPSGVQFVPGASGLSRLAHLSDFQRAQLMQELASLEAENEVIVVDTGAGIGPDVLHFACAADMVLVVTTPEPTSVTDAYAFIKVLSQRGFAGNVALLVNLVADRQEGRLTYQRISQVARQFLNVKVLDAGYVLDDPKVREAIRLRQPFVLAFPRCAASRCLTALASRLSRGGTVNQQKEGFFRRVASWFS